MQFNDFVATGFNQLVNNAAKIRYRWGGSVPMVVRMPWGGLRHAGPYHSQNTEAWFYRTAGTEDRRAVNAARTRGRCWRRPSPTPTRCSSTSTSRSIATRGSSRCWAPLQRRQLPLGKAALRRAGGDLAIVSYGAYVHVALRVAATLAADGIEAASSTCARWRHSTSRRCSPSRVTAAAC